MTIYANLTAEQKAARVKRTKESRARRRVADEDAYLARRRKHGAMWRAQDGNLEVKRINQQRRRVTMEQGSFTLEEWVAIQEAQSHCCFYCGEGEVPLTIEHMTPLIRGGRHDKDNIVAACSPCNCRKRDKTAEEFIQWLAKKEMVGE